MSASASLPSAVQYNVHHEKEVTNLPVKIVLCGPPNTGKSCLREGLKRAILDKGLDYPYPYCLPANPDGDGAWFLPTAWVHPNQAVRYREIAKKKFTPEFAKLTAQYVRKCALPLVFVDIGGKPLPDNLEICAAATHAVILGKGSADFETWRTFCAEAKLTVVAEIRSDYFATEDGPVSVDSAGVLCGTVHHLDRKEPAEDRPVIQALAERILTLTGKKPVAGIARSPFIVTPGAPSGDTLVLDTAFGRPASNPEIVRAALEALRDILALPSEFRTLLFDGPISVLAASALAWQAAQRFPAIGFYDPKLNHYAIVYAGHQGDALDWNPEPGAVLDFGPVPKPPKRRPEREDAEKIFFVRAMEQQGDATRVEIGPGAESADTFELVPAALDQLAAIPSETSGLLFDGKVPIIVAAALTCAAMQRFDYVAFLDPRLKRFVVSASKLPSRAVGTQL